MQPSKTTIIAVCRRVVPTWSTLLDDKINVRPLLGGMTNYLFVCQAEAPVQPEQVVVRVLSEELEDIVNRDIELKAMQHLAEAGISPAVYGQEGNFRVEQFLEGRCMTQHELSRKENLVRMIPVLRQIHSTKPDIPHSSPYIDRALDIFSTRAQATASDLGAASAVVQVNIARILAIFSKAEVAALTELLKRTESPVVFCHNDMNAGNWMVSTTPQTRRAFQVVDLEYADYNYRGFDLGNLCCEFAYDYTVPDYPYFRVQQDAFPDEHILAWIANRYLTCESAGDSTPTPSTGSGATSTPMERRESIASASSALSMVERTPDVSHLIREIRVAMLASHALWALWSISMAVTSKASDYAYDAYGRSRAEQYLQHRNAVCRDYSALVEGLEFSTPVDPASPTDGGSE